MIKIVLVAPFENFIDNEQGIFRLHNFKDGKWQDEEFVLEEIVVNPKKLVHFKIDADAIIARGLYAEILKSTIQDIPIIEIVVQGSDMIDNIMMCKQMFGNKQIGVVAASNMVYDVDEMSDITKLKVKSYSLESGQSADIAVKRAVSDGCGVILGTASSCRAATRHGLDNMLIKTGQKSFYQSITEAKRAAKISRKAQEKGNMYKTILDYTYDGIIAVNQDNQIIKINTSAKDMLNIKEDQAAGSDMESVLFSQELKDVIMNGREYIDEIIQKDNEPIMLNKVFTNIKGKKIGCVITMQKIQKIQNMENQVRKGFISNGYNAKFTFQDIVAVSDVTKNIVQVAKKFSLTESNILLTGKSGTGKEIFAQSIHNFSDKKNGPFVAVNCASIPENLLESELFGYAPGAFTGALKTGKLGFFGLAHNGTIFLDEIAELSLELQAKLLRVLQERQFTRLGDNKVINVNIRIIAATNKNLNELVKKGLFREDLYYRLDVLRIDIPNLSDRREDIPALADQFIKKLNPHKILSEKAKEILKSFNWEGNVRQIRNFCERLDALSTSRVISEEDIMYVQKLAPDSLDDIQDQQSLHLDNFPKNDEEDRIRKALIKTKYNKQDAAKLLNINRSTLWRKMKEFAID